jgi:hypothetical protein
MKRRLNDNDCNFPNKVQHVLNTNNQVTTGYRFLQQEKKLQLCTPNLEKIVWSENNELDSSIRELLLNCNKSHNKSRDEKIMVYIKKICRSYDDKIWSFLRCELLLNFFKDFVPKKEAVVICIKSVCRNGHVNIMNIFMKDKRFNKYILGKPIFDIFDVNTSCLEVNGQSEILKILTSSNIQLKHDNKVLKKACKWNRVGIVQILLEDGRINPNINNCLDEAIKNDNPNVVELLLDDDRINIDNSVLKFACKTNTQQRTKMVKKLLKKEKVFIDAFCVVNQHEFKYDNNYNLLFTTNFVKNNNSAVMIAQDKNNKIVHKMLVQYIAYKIFCIKEFAHDMIEHIFPVEVVNYILWLGLAKQCN